MLVQVNERGTIENFVLKCTERLCGAAQLEIMEQTQRTSIWKRQKENQNFTIICCHILRELVVLFLAGNAIHRVYSVEKMQ